MNFETLYEMQKELDARIIREKGLEGQDLLPNTVLALQVEICELANEWRGFKHWSSDREPRTRVKNCLGCNGCETSAGCEICCGANPLLEEYVDCLHFFLSIARQLDAKEIFSYKHRLGEESIIDQFIDIMMMVGEIREQGEEAWESAFLSFIDLGHSLGFTWDQIAAAYVAKNQVNHERQSNGY